MTERHPEVSLRAVPREYGGKWVAWDYERDRIIASSELLNDLVKVAPQSDEAEIAYEWIPPASVRLVGATL